ncbi:hypothetical protein V6N11_080727 [Hibiscus sabdariffa]|uniref:RNase H type-1 domain-containing protein n=1 Tax=Hibiscus sabdariffa TaxID=183260 RepID=A0ABR2QHZ5_9ROSI
MFDVNKAFLQKLGFLLITDLDALWVILLRQKYRVIDICPSTIARTTYTPRALSNGWDEFLPNVAWSVGNGSSIRLYSDIWVPSLGPLCHHTLADPNTLEAQSITDLVSSDGNWSLQTLQHHFTESAIAHIIGIRCPDPLDDNDRAVWRWTPRSIFELKSAYLRLVGSHWPPRQSIWKLIWRLAVPQCVRLFLWLAFQQRLMTNATRHCRNLAASPTCPLCRSMPETVLHTLRDCAESFYGSASATLAPVPASLPASATIWKPPEQGWICLNVDGVVSLQSGVGAIGGLARNSLGEWLVGFSKTLGHSDALRAELWAIYDRLKLVWDCGFRRLLVQSDCRQAIDLICSAEANSSALSLVRAITRLRRMDWEVAIIWTPRDANRASDSMAKLADPYVYSLSIFHVASLEVVKFIELDKLSL